jgi:hypothetical protein
MEAKRKRRRHPNGGALRRWIRRGFRIILPQPLPTMAQTTNLLPRPSRVLSWRMVGALLCEGPIENRALGEYNA